MYIFNLEMISEPELEKDSGITKAVRHARMAHKATEWRIKKELTGPVMRPSREIASKTYTSL